MAATDFFSRWAQKPAATGAPAPASQALPSAQPAADTPTAATTATEPGAPTAPPSVEQARQLTPADDFKAFVQPDVAPEVRNTAMRQLFTDPHFNVMDGLDIYIDDYNKPDPLPAGDLARMVSAHALRLLKSEPDSAPAPLQHPTDVGTPEPVEPTQENHLDDPDLRLQPNPAPRPAGHGSGTD